MSSARYEGVSTGPKRSFVLQEAKCALLFSLARKMGFEQLFAPKESLLTSRATCLLCIEGLPPETQRALQVGSGCCRACGGHGGRMKPTRSLSCALRRLPRRPPVFPPPSVLALLLSAAQRSPPPSLPQRSRLGRGARPAAERAALAKLPDPSRPAPSCLPVLPSLRSRTRLGRPPRYARRGCCDHRQGSDTTGGAGEKSGEPPTGCLASLRLFLRPLPLWGLAPTGQRWSQESPPGGGSLGRVAEEGESPALPWVVAAAVRLCRPLGPLGQLGGRRPPAGSRR